jgi:hypothetical protein
VYHFKPESKRQSTESARKKKLESALSAGKGVIEDFWDEKNVVMQLLGVGGQ